MSPASGATRADLVARMPLAGLRPSAPPVEDWGAWWDETTALPCRCTLAVGRRAGAAQPACCLITKLLLTVPKHPMRNLWHAIEPEFLAEGVASVSHDRRRGAGSTPVSTAPLPLPSALGSPVAPIVRDSPAAPHAELVLLLSVDCSIPSWGAPRPGRGLGRGGASYRGNGRPLRPCTGASRSAQRPAKDVTVGRGAESAAPGEALEEEALDEEAMKKGTSVDGGAGTGTGPVAYRRHGRRRHKRGLRAGGL